MELSPPRPTSSNNSYTTKDENSQISVKRKRTERRSAFPLLDPSSSSTSSAQFLASPSEEEEEEDMANCLILLAKGRAGSFQSKAQDKAPPPTTSPYLYECKTCNKRFPTFQALGGHRASHKKPRATISSVAIDMIIQEKKMVVEEEIFPSSSAQFQHIKRTTTNVLNSNINSNRNKSRVHECSICGSEFSSGQALGGHMRRHRSTTTTETVQEGKKMKTISLPFDLNLPAPLDDDHTDFAPTFSFPVTQPPMIFSTSTLVDCHY